jgi:hypothetical protein
MGSFNNQQQIVRVVATTTTTDGTSSSTAGDDKKKGRAICVSYKCNIRPSRTRVGLLKHEAFQGFPVNCSDFGEGAPLSTSHLLT